MEGTVDFELAGINVSETFNCFNTYCIHIHREEQYMFKGRN